jgi:hypothetical protein
MTRDAAKRSLYEPSPVTMRHAAKRSVFEPSPAKRSVFEPSPATSPAKRPVFEPSPMVDTGNYPYNDDFCYYGMGDEDDFDDSYCDPSDLGCYDDDYFMEGIEFDHLRMLD